MYTHCRQSQSEDYQGHSYSQTKLLYSHLTRISKDAMKQQPLYKKITKNRYLFSYIYICVLL